MTVREVMYLADKTKGKEGVGKLEGVDFSESGVSEFHKKKLIKQQRKRRTSELLDEKIYTLSSKLY